MKRIIIVLLLAPSLLMSQNLINNGGFENNLNSWYLDSTTNYQAFFADAENPNTGNKCLKLVLQDGDTASFGQIIPINANQKYKIGYSVKTENVQNYLLSFVQYVKNGFNNVFSLYMVPEANVPNWLEREGRIICPEDAENLIFLFVFYGPGVIYIDDVFIYQEQISQSTGFYVDIANTVFPFKNLFQSNGIDPGNYNTPDVVSSFQDLGIDYVRTHDFAIAFDHSTIVGISDDSYDPQNPEAYHFHTSDSMAANIYNAGGKLFYRFGQSYNYDPMYSQPPTNPEKWAEVCVQIIKHYNDAWNNGHNYNIDYFEIWNEPDLPEFWSGTVQQYIQLYRITANKIKEYNPNLKVGGPAIANPFNQKFISEFLDSVTTYNIPLDFFSYHLYYLPNPYQFKLTNDYVRNLLDSYGLQNVEIVNSEWNTGHFNPDDFWANTFSLNDAQNAAQVISCLTYMQETEIDLFFRYAFRNYWFGMVEDNGQLRYSGLAYKAFYNLCKNSQRLHTSGGDNIGNTIIASKNEEIIQILISDNASNAQGYNLNLTNTENNVEYDYSIYRIDSENIYQLAEQGMFTNQNPIISIQVEAPYADHIIINQNIISDNYVENVENVKLFPNPAKESTVLYFDRQHQSINVRIFDANSKLIKQSIHKNSNRAILNVEDITPGVYFVNYSTNSSKGALKLIVK